MEIAGVERPAKYVIGCAATLGAALIGGIFQLASSMASRGAVQTTTTTSAATIVVPEPTTVVSSDVAPVEAAAVADLRKTMSQLQKQNVDLTFQTRDLEYQLRVVSLVPNFVNQGKEQFDHVTLVNTCSQQIEVAVQYQSVERKLVTRGWWAVAPNTTQATDILSTGPQIAFFAKNRSTGMMWNGANDAVQRTLMVRSDQFILYDGEKIVGDDWTPQIFLVRNAPATWSTYSQTFTCPAQ